MPFPAFPLFGVQMYESEFDHKLVLEQILTALFQLPELGYQWAGTLLAFLALALAP